MNLVKTNESEPGIFIITLNRPEKRNALSTAVMEELCSSIREVHRNPAARVIILRGEGPVFCAGLDLKETQDSSTGAHSAELVREMLEEIYQSPLVTIAAIHGGAIAGGAGLMSVCDLVVATEGTKIGYPETKRGLVAGLVMTFLRRQLRERDARELLLVPDLIDAQRAREMGLVSRVVEETQLMEEAMKLGRSVLQGAPCATAATKRFLDGLWHSSVPDDLDQAHHYHMQARNSEEAKEGIQAFLEKREPAWIGS
jgi:methylglutaconyl-CoA hydratase